MKCGSITVVMATSTRLVFGIWINTSCDVFAGDCRRLMKERKEDIFAQKYASCSLEVNIAIIFLY